MKVLAIGIEYVKGIKKENQRPFEFANLVYGVPVQNSAGSPNYQRQINGYDVQKMSIPLDKLPELMQEKLPAQAELVTEARPDYRGQAVAYCVSIKPIK